MVVVVVFIHYLSAVGQPCPVVLQRQTVRAYGLQMSVVGGRSSTVGAVVEYGEFGITLYHAEYLAITRAYALRVVAVERDGKVDGQNGEGVDQQREVVVQAFGHLLLRTVVGAEEAGPMGYAAGIDARTGRDHAGRVELHLQQRVAATEAALLYMVEVAEALAGVAPELQLAVYEAVEFAAVALGLAVQLLAGFELEGAQPVFIEIVGILAFYAEGGV